MGIRNLDELPRIFLKSRRQPLKALQQVSYACSELCGRKIFKRQTKDRCANNRNKTIDEQKTWDEIGYKSKEQKTVKNHQQSIHISTPTTYVHIQPAHRNIQRSHQTKVLSLAVLWRRLV